MTLTIKYFGLLAEITSCSEEDIQFSNDTISKVLDVLYTKYPKLKDADFQVAQNNQITNLEDNVSANEIALLPPFSGG